MSFPAYSAYRDTGVEWLGAVPSHWQVTRLNSLFREVSEPGSDDLPVLSVSIHSGVSDTELADDEMDRVVARSEDRSKYKRVEPNDLVYNMMRAWQGGFGAVQALGAVSPAYVVARPTSSQSTVFIERLLRTPNAVREMKSLSKGVTDFRLRLYWDEFKNIKVALPPPDEQLAIDAFLDRETTKIDALVEAQKRLIALLKEKRQAVISNAVTKGLDPSAPMKDSGVEWLGQVPAHWKTCQLKQLVFFQRGHDLPSQDRREGDIPIYSSGGLLGYHDEAVAFGPAIITGRYGSIGEFDLVDGPYWPLNTALYSIELQGHPIFTRYALENLRPLFLMHAAKSAVPGVDRNDIHRLFVAMPSQAEQAEIGSYLDQLSAQWQALLDQAEAAITLLQERRAALISAAVTGKIDVRGLVQTAEAA